VRQVAVDTAFRVRASRRGTLRFKISTFLSFNIFYVSTFEVIDVRQMKKVPNAIDREIGRRIKAKRLLLGHNQQFLAETIGVSYQQVQKYENGTDRVGASRLFAISKALDVPIAYFFESDLSACSEDSSDYELENQAVRRTVATGEGRSLVLSFARIRDPQLRTKVLELAELLSDAKRPTKPRQASKVSLT